MISTTFYSDFTIADAFGPRAVMDTYKRAFREWKSDHRYLTALVITLNHKIWEHYEAGHIALAELYDTLWRQADGYALDTLEDKALDYYLEETD